MLGVWSSLEKPKTDTSTIYVKCECTLNPDKAYIYVIYIVNSFYGTCYLNIIYDV